MMQHLHSHLPDLPRWVETRDLLQREGSQVAEHQYQSGFVVWNSKHGLGSVVGEPEAEALKQAAVEVPELLAFPENIERVRPFLPEFNAEPATVFSASAQLPSAPPHLCREIGLREITAQAHLPDDLAAELRSAAGDDVPMVAAFDGPLPVAFSFVAAQTESLIGVGKA
ncbi:MAG: hypothetical protein LAT62_16120 [Natronospirillum sp.]|uniref:hypothetical protein n=1 Tax=Natronospirillum sp. TaxID=2812955 RepID=UPI0025F07507|nr:hypothetical protein [Natronospirillum sp.]MCH8553464.1 hypothetical protein [Natronospirillum sp.]